MKRGPDAITYTFDPPACEDSGCLVAPANCGNEDNQQCGLSHIDFCYDPPSIDYPADVTMECDESTDPSNTGFPTVDPELCDGATITYSDSETAGDCPQEKTITRTFSVTIFGFGTLYLHANHSGRRYYAAQHHLRR